MSEENIGIKIIDCTKSCKMTRQVRGSDLCTGKARVVGSSIFYDCKEALAEKDRDQRQFFSCDLWDNGLEDSCFSCQLECSNNKNDKMAAVLAQKKELDDVIEKLKPNMVLYGVSAKQVSQISEKYTKKQSDGKRDQMGSEAIQAANFANDALKMILKGNRVDLAFFSLYARKTSGRLKRLRKKGSTRAKAKSQQGSE